MSTRIKSKDSGDDRWGSKPKKYKVSEVTNMISRVWQSVYKFYRKGIYSFHQPNGVFKVTHGCQTPTLQLFSLVHCLCLREAPLLALRHMVRLYLILGGGPVDIGGVINSTNPWRQGPAQDVPYNLIMLYVSKSFIYRRNRTKSQ